MSEHDPTAHVSAWSLAGPSMKTRRGKRCGPSPNPALLDTIAACFKPKPKVRELAALMTVLGYVTKNTGSARGKRLTMEVLERP